MQPQPTVRSLSAEVREYVCGAGFIAVARWRDGHVEVTKDPTGAVTVWWCQPCMAYQVMRKAEAGVTMDDASRQLGVPLTDHATLVMRTKWRGLSSMFARGAV
jgi:hypothetical protein